MHAGHPWRYLRNLSESTMLPPALPAAEPGRRLCGRQRECEALDRLLAQVWAGHTRALVLRGEAGVGKTALLGYLLERARGCHVVRAAGVESETELAFAGLHQLCAPFLDRLERLPGPQRDALATAFSLQGGDAPDRFTVGLAVLGLLSDLAKERPLVCVVDDAQWLDRASARALAFVARRLVPERVAVIFAVRRPDDDLDLTGLPELAVRGLADGDARTLLDSAVIGPLDEQVRDRIVAEARGNPRALLELARGLTPEDLAGGFGLPAAAAVPDRIEQSVQRRLAPLPPATRLLLLIAAAEPVLDPMLVWRAAHQLGIEDGAAAPAAAAGLIEFGRQVRFRDPLAWSAVYRAASAEERRSVHRALAEATDSDIDPDRRAWHLAYATPRPDQQIAAELERSVGRARVRGGLAAAAAFCERAAWLTPPARRAQRALVAALAKHQCGAPDSALRLLALAQAGPLDELGHARAELLAPDGGQPRPRLRTRRCCWSRPPGACSRSPQRWRARPTRRAFCAALTTGRLPIPGGMLQAAEAVRATPPAVAPPGAADLLLDGLAMLTTEGYAAGTPMLKRGLSAFGDKEASSEGEFAWLPLACRVAQDVWDDERWHACTTRLIGLARQAGALSVLPAALMSGAAIQLLAGEPATAITMAGEADASLRRRVASWVPTARLCWPPGAAGKPRPVS